MKVSLRRRVLAEFLGTALLVAIVVGSGIAAQTLSSDPGLQLLENALVTAGGLAVLILVFEPVSGAHFNPVVSAADWWLGRPTGSGLAAAELAAYVVVQTAGGLCGTVLAHAMFDHALVTWGTQDRAQAHLLLSELVATAGLLLVIFSLARTGRSRLAAVSVGAYIGAAYFWTSSTSFANPAVTVARALTDTFAGIDPAAVPAFVVAQVVGLVAALGLILVLYPHSFRVAGDLAVGHPADESPRTDPAARRGAREF